MRPPADDASDLEWLLFEQSDVLTAAQATRLLTRAAVRHRIATKRWQRAAPGVVVAHAGPVTGAQAVWVAVLAAGSGAVLAGLAAARAGGLRGTWTRDAIDVLVPGHRHPPDLTRFGVRVRRTSVLPREDLQRGRPDRTSMARSVVDAAQWSVGADEGRMIIAAACQQGRASPADVLAVLARLPRARRRDLLVQTVRDVEGGAGSLAEIDFVRLCRRHGLPPPDLQERRRDDAGRIRYLDAYWRASRLHAEVDGGHHREVRHWEADMERQNAVWISGDRVLRFSAARVRTHPGEVAATLRRALAAAGWTPI